MTKTDTERAIVTGADTNGLGDALETKGVDVRRIEGIVSASRLREAGIEDATLLVLTEMDEATAIPVARELRSDLRIVTYAERSLPGFASGQTDLAIDPALLSPAIVAEELLA